MATTRPDPVQTAWRFDAIDPVAGIAFASRIGGGENDDDLVAFRPPAFEPEHLGRSSIALGATRRGFQAGWLIGDQEATFPSLASIGEFVRRAYVRGAGGDPDGQGGGSEGGPPPPDTDNRPQEDGVVAGSAKEFDAMVAALADFERRVNECASGGASPMTWPDESESDAPAQLGELLARGAAHAVRDMLVAFEADGLDQTHAWLLYNAVRRTAIDPVPLARRVVLHPALKHARYIGELYALFDDFAYRPWYAEWIGRPADPLEIAARVPGPRFRQAATSGSLLAWLTRFLATPCEALKVMPARECVERALFAAAVIASPGTDAGPVWTDSEISVAARRDLAKSAFSWLREHLPCFAFSAAYENELAAVKPTPRPQGPSASASSAVA